MTRCRVLDVCAGFLAVLMTIATVKAATMPGNLEYLTFKAPVELPGVTLDPGTYAFEMLNPQRSRQPLDVVRVRNRATNQVRFVGPTRNVERPDGLSENRSIVMGESRPGVAPRILGWYPIGQRSGHEFIYNIP